MQNQNPSFTSQQQAGIEQINLGYNEQQDRLLLKLGLSDKTEIVVWVTRRICKAMSGLLQGVAPNMLPTAPLLESAPITTPDSKGQAIESFKREAAEQQVLNNMDFNSEYLADRQARTQEPMLAVQCVIISAENQAPSLELQCSNNQTVKIALNNELVHAITNMIQLATREAGWDLLVTVDSSNVLIASNQALLH